jgi:hypothetical protein
MKRVFALGFAALLFGVAGLAQISGSWYGKIYLLPSVYLDETKLTLTYSVAGFDITSESKFTGAGFVSQKFEISGALGPIEVSGTMGFDPSVPAYSYTDVSGSLSFAGLEITTKVFHGVYPYAVSYFEYNYSLIWEELCFWHDGPYYIMAEDGLVSDLIILMPMSLMLYTLEVTVEPISITVRFLDCCEGIEFYDFTLTLTDLSICCGISYDFELYFTKAGFDYAKFTVDNLFELCCGIAFGVTVEFGVDYKAVTPSFTWGGIEGCVTVWGDLQLKPHHEVGVEGWELFGYKVVCELADCNSITFGTAFLKWREVGWYVDEEDNWYKGDPWDYTGTPPPGWQYNAYDYTSEPKVAADLGLKDYYFVGVMFDDIDQDDMDEIIVDYYDITEFELLQFSFCGPACCGGNWTVDVKLYWAEFWYEYWVIDPVVDGEPTVTQVDAGSIYPTLFGLDRIVLEASVPLNDALTLGLGLSLFLFDVDETLYFLYFTNIPEPAELYVTWDFTF